MRKNFILAVSMLLWTSAFVGCTNEESDSWEQNDLSVEAGIGFQESRTTLLDDNETVVWSRNDQIYLFGGNSNATMTLTEGEGKTTGTFSGNVCGWTSQLQYALYPVPTIDGGTYSYNLPSELTYSENSKAPMFGTYSKQNVQFGNLTSLVRIPLVNLDASKENVLKLTMPGVTGTATVDLEEGRLSFPETGMGDEITVTIPAGIITCNVDIPVPAKTYSGYRIELNDHIIASQTKQRELSVNEVAVLATGQIYGGEIKFPEATEGVYIIENITELILLSQEVAEGRTFYGETVNLSENIDLGGIDWTPIGNSTNKFRGTFDGANHTVSNLYIAGNNSDVGLFGFTTDGEIKNLTIKNAKVSGYLNVGVVAGTPYTSKYTSVSVTGHVEVNGYAYVGGVGGKNAYADWKNITVNADATSYVKAESENYRTYVGGVVGFNGEGVHSFTNITSNINVSGSTCDVGGLFGIAHYNNKFVNCTSSGNVEITNAAEAGDAEEIGGIAGVWHNGDGTTVTFTGCSFTGTLETNIGEDVDLSDNTIVGKAYKTDGTGQLIIDQVKSQVVSDSDALTTAVKAGVTNLYLIAEEYDLEDLKNKTFTINGTKETIIKVVGEGQGEANGQLDYALDGSTVTFNGVTIKTNNQTYAGYARLKSTFNNCTFENHFCINGNSTFANCTMNVSGDQYNIWTWGGETIKFEGCTFNSDGKALLLYGTVDTKMTVNNCIFNDEGGLSDLKAAIEIGNDYKKSYELIVNNTTVNGYEINDKGINTGTALWANKNSMGTDKLNVVVDGVDVY